MSDDEENGGGNGGNVEQVARIGREFAEALAAETASVKLQNGREITGTIEGFSIRRRERKGDVSWSGNIKIRTESGVLQIDCLDVESVAAG